MKISHHLHRLQVKKKENLIDIGGCCCFGVEKAVWVFWVRMETGVWMSLAVDLLLTMMTVGQPRRLT